ncbi:hypothetical protein AgCh_017271 [Apium graveolens]
MCTSVLLVGKSKEKVNAPQFMDFAAADLLDYAISSSQSHFRSDLIVQGSLVDQLPLQVLGEDTDPKAICQWSVSTSPGLNPLDASADSGSDIDSSDEFNKDGNLRTPIAPPMTSLRMAKVIFLAGGEARDMGFSTGNVVVQMKMELLEDMFSLEEHLLGIWKMLNLIQNFSAIYFALNSGSTVKEISQSNICQRIQKQGSSTDLRRDVEIMGPPSTHEDQITYVHAILRNTVIEEVSAAVKAAVAAMEMSLTNRFVNSFNEMFKK